MDQKKEGLDIYKELETLEHPSFSQASREFQHLFGNRCIKGFLHQKVLRQQLSKKIAKEQFKYFENAKTPRKINEELTKFAKENIVLYPNQINNLENSINHSTLQSYPDDFLEFIKKLKLQRQKEFEEEEQKKNMPKVTKKFEINPQYLKYIQSQKNKIPPSCKYNPNYEAIAPHVPLVKLQPLKTKGERSKSVDTSLVKNRIKEKKPPIHNRSVLKNVKRKNSIHVMSFDKYSSRNDMIKKPYGNTSLDPNKMSRNISVPNFKKMISRFDKNSKTSQKLPNLINYSPNYNAIYHNNLGYRKENQDLCRKKAMIKKLWGSFVVPTEYLVVPSMNDQK